MPDWMRPTAAQIVTAHPAWIDVMPWYLLYFHVFPALAKILLGQRRGIDCVGKHDITTNMKLSKMFQIEQYQSIGHTNQKIL